MTRQTNQDRTSKVRHRIGAYAEAAVLKAGTGDMTRSAQRGISPIMQSFLAAQVAVNPRFTRVLMFLLFDSIVIGELVLWNAYLAYVMIFGLHMNDFGKFYYSAVAYVKGGDMYGPSPATWLLLDGSNAQQFWNLNPPHFHIVLLPLALLQPNLAVTIWGVVNIACLIVSCILVTRELGMNLRGPWGWRLAIVGTLSFAGTGATVITGQLTFVLLLIVTISWLQARAGRWNRAAIFLGVAISLKLFMLIFLPYLILKRQFRAVFICVLAACLCLGIGLLVFGLDAHLHWLRAMEDSSSWIWASMNASIMGFLGRTLDISPHFQPTVLLPHLVKPLWLITAGIIYALTVAATFRNQYTLSADRDFAILLVAAVLISPLGWIYYLWLPFGPILSIFTSVWRSMTLRSALNRKPGLLLGAMLALFVPIHVLVLSNPNPWATVMLGSSYFWGTLALWFGLFLYRDISGSNVLDAQTKGT